MVTTPGRIIRVWPEEALHMPSSREIRQRGAVAGTRKRQRRAGHCRSSRDRVRRLCAAFVSESAWELYGLLESGTHGWRRDQMASPTSDDAQLMIQIAQWGTSLGVQEAMPRIFADDFDPDTADAMSDQAVRTMLMFGESIGTLTKNDLLSVELVRDWLWVEGIWSRVGPAALMQRDKFGE